MQSVGLIPGEFEPTPENFERLARVIGAKPKALGRRFAANRNSNIVLVARRVTPEIADRVTALELEGVRLERDYRRFYPSGEASAHVIGFTDVDDVGQEGLELALESRLAATPGLRRVMRDRTGRLVDEVGLIEAAHDGVDVALALDHRLQYIAYRELKAAVQSAGARGGSLVLLDPATGEILAMANQPSFNPNSADKGELRARRNAAVADVIEPGSTLKPFTIAAALEAHALTPGSIIETSPGWMRVGKYTVRDHRDYGAIPVADVIRHSSNVGAGKIALAQPRERLAHLYDMLGFGRPTQSAFPGEGAGQLAPPGEWSDAQHATLGYGYGIGVTTLQLAQAYAVIANDGVFTPVTFELRDGPVEQTRVLDAQTARQLRAMLETVVRDGTGRAAAVPRYRVGGKTGTVHKVSRDGYSEDRYRALFAGMAPITTPELVLVVVIDEPAAGEYFGGQVAAPVFSAVMAQALRLRSIAPELERPATRLASSVGAP